MMLSIAKIESVAQGISYYQKDNYYSKKEQKEHTEWYGKAAKKLGLIGKVEFNAFSKALQGVSDTGELNAGPVLEKDQSLSSEDRLQFQKNLYGFLDSQGISVAVREDLQKIFSKMCLLERKISGKNLLKYEKSLFSLLNKEFTIGLHEKKEIKKELHKRIQIFLKKASRRSAFDLTFSAPKSVSLAALVGGNKDLVLAHRAAVQYALSVVEAEYSQIRVLEKQERLLQVTGNIAAALFEHDVSREVDPQLHTHCVLMNFTQKKDGCWRSLHQDGFYYDSKKIGSIYQNEFARRVQELGYEIQINSTGTFDLVGYTREQKERFSKRTLQLGKMGARTQKEKTKLIKVQRRKKNEEMKRTELKKIWTNEAKSLGLVHPKPDLKKRKKLILQEKKDLQQVICDALRDVTSTDVSFRKSILEANVLGKSLGVYDYFELKRVVDQYVQNNAKKVHDKKNEFVTNEIILIEHQTIALMQKGKELFPGILPGHDIPGAIEEVELERRSFGFMGFHEGQRQAIELFLNSRDRVFAWQGVAGAGKSFSLGAAVQIAKDHGFVVKGFAPKAEAAKVLAVETNLDEASTVASLLVLKTQAGRAAGREIWVVDEAGLLSAAEAYLLLKKAEIENARVLLVGDTRQLSSVGAGHPFKQLQEHGMRTAQLTQSVRQRDLTLKRSVALMADGEHLKGLDLLDRGKKVFELGSQESLVENMVQDYLGLTKEERKKSLFISSTNCEKEQITERVRAGLKKRNELGDVFDINCYSPRDFSEHALKYASVYEVGDVVIPHKRSQGLSTNVPYKVLSLSSARNTVVLETKTGEKEVKASLLKCNLFQQKTVEIALGEKLKWIKNHSVSDDEQQGIKKRRRLNGQSFTCIELDKQKMIAVFQYENGTKEIVSLKESQFLNYDYVSTVHASQGKTCDKVYVSLSNIDRENFYVAASRAKFDCKMYVLDKEQLYKNVEKTGANQTAEELLNGQLKNKKKIDLTLQR